MIQSGCVLKVGVVGLNHKTADLAFREAMARGASSLSGEKAYFFPHPIVLLSTCNRMEIYFGGDDLAAIHSDLLGWLRSHIPEPFEHRLYSYFGIDCFAHLGFVAAGLDSAIIAETHIQRQVKVAYAKACEYSRLPFCLHYVFQKALKLGKVARNQVQMDRSAPTLVQAIWQLATLQFGSMEGKRILLIGYSETNRRISFFLFQRGMMDFSLATANPAKVNLQGCRACDRTQIGRWKEYDLIISAANSDRYMIDGKSEKRHVIFDLSVPRTVDPEVGISSNVTLYNIEQMNEWIECRRAMQSDQFAMSKGLVWEGATRLAAAYRRKLLYCETVEAAGIGCV